MELPFQTLNRRVGIISFNFDGTIVYVAFGDRIPHQIPSSAFSILNFQIPFGRRPGDLAAIHGRN